MTGIGTWFTTINFALNTLRTTVVGRATSARTAALYVESDRIAERHRLKVALGIVQTLTHGRDFHVRLAR
jgi:hypothetical protein